HSEFQFISAIETEGSAIPGPCAMVHIDSRGLYLHCGSQRRIVERDKLRSFQVVKAGPPAVGPEKPVGRVTQSPNHKRPNSSERPGTWVTKQTGNIGNTLGRRWQSDWWLLCT